MRDIVLLPIGGASEISGLPGSPSDELAIAIAGPLASLVVGLGLASRRVARQAGIPGRRRCSRAPSPARLGWANLLLAGFNLLPAIPMDGGRVLRALLARRRSDLQATVLAVRVEPPGRRSPWCWRGSVTTRGCASSACSSLSAPAASSGRRRSARRPGASRSHDVMVHDPTTLEASFPLSAVAPFLQATPGRILPVIDNGRYLGLIAADHLPGPPGALLVGDATDRLAPALSPGDPVYPLAFERLLGGRRRAATVIEDGRVVGVLYSPHLLAAVRRATAAAGASTMLP